MKMCFDHYGKDWYLLPADLRCTFNDEGYAVTCAEDEMTERENEANAVAWVETRRKFREKYSQYRIEHNIATYTFENAQWDGYLDCSGDAQVDDDGEAK